MTARFTPENALKYAWATPEALLDAISPINAKYFNAEMISQLFDKGLSAKQIAAAFGVELIAVLKLVNESRQGKTAAASATADSAGAEAAPPMPNRETPAAPPDASTPQELYLKLAGQSAPEGIGILALYKLLLAVGADREAMKKVYKNRQLYDCEAQIKKAAAKARAKEAAAPSNFVASASRRRGARQSTPAQPPDAPESKNAGIDREAFAEAVADMGDALAILENSRFACAAEFAAFFDIFSRKLRKLQAMLAPGKGADHA
jgi:hypothetical protein